MKMMKENKGLTLVELLITIAILAIVVAAATSFMITGSKSFTKGNADSELQREAELTVNQIEDMVIDTNGGLTVEYEYENPGAGEGEDKGAVTKTELTMYHAEKETDETGAEVLDYVKESVVWNPAGGDDVKDKIYYSKWNVSYDSDSGSFVTDGPPEADNQLLAERVSLFEVDTDTEDEMAADGTINTIVRSVQVRVGYENGFGRVEYATSPIITLRNRMLLSADPDMIFEVPEKVDANFRLYYKSDGGTDVPLVTQIVDGSSAVQRGSRYQIYAHLTKGDTDISDLVNWKIEESESFSSIDAASGKLSVHPNEPCEYLSVTASYKSNPAKKATGVLKVEGGSGKSFTAIKIITDSLEPFSPHYDSYATFEGIWSPEEMAALTYTWEVSDPDMVEPFVNNEKTLALSVKKSAANYGKTFRIRLTATSEVTGETRWDEITYRIDSEGATGGDSNMNRGMGVGSNGEGSGHGKINYTFDIPFSASKVEYTYYFCDESGQRVTEDNEKYGHCIVFNDGGSMGTSGYYTLTFSEELPVNRAFYVYVEATCTSEWYTPPKGPWTYSRIHYIPAVQLISHNNGVLHKNGDNYAGGKFECNFSLLAYYNVAAQGRKLSEIIDWEVLDFDYEVTAEEGMPNNPVKVRIEMADPVARGEDSGSILDVNRMYLWGFVHADDIQHWQKLKVTQLTIRIYMAEDHNIYTDLIFYPE